MCGLGVLLINVKTYCKQAKPSVNAKAVPAMGSKVSVSDQYNTWLCAVVCAVCSWL